MSPIDTKRTIKFHGCSLLILSIGIFVVLCTGSCRMMLGKPFFPSEATHASP